MADGQATFDFRHHEQEAVTSYLKVRDFYRDLALAVRRIVEECLRQRQVPAQSVEARAKDPASFGRKASIPSEADANRPKYEKPLDQIFDLAGIRVIAYFPSALREVDDILRAEFEILERSDKSEILIEEDRFGYQSVHYLVRISAKRCAFAEYDRFRGAIAEIQVRTILQHAWAEIEHDIQYKSSAAIPTEIHRRFMALAGLLEIADREFQAIQDEDKQLRASARTLVSEGQLGNVEITPDAVKAYLDRKLGADGRISDWQYDWEAKLLKRLGFKTLEQIDECVRGYDDDRLSRAIWGTRQGQVTRFEFMLLAAMGENYIRRHVFVGAAWFADREHERLKKFADANITIGSYDPVAAMRAEDAARPSNMALNPTGADAPAG